MTWDTTPDLIEERLAWRLRNSGKHCSRCKEVRPISAFHRDISRDDGLAKHCNKCRAEKYREKYGH